MKMILQLVSFVGLAAVMVPCFLMLLGMMDLEFVKTLALIGTIVWFVAVPAWMKVST